MTNGKWLCSYRFFILDKPAEFRKQACRKHEDHGLALENTGHEFPLSVMGPAR